MDNEERKRPKSQRSEKFDRRCVNLWIGDWEWLQAVHAKEGPGVAIRVIVRKYRERVQERASNLPSPDSLEISLEDIDL